jgi:hypothetical protein
MNVTRTDGTTETTHGALSDLLAEAEQRLAEPDVESVEIFKDPATQYPNNRNGRRRAMADFRKGNASRAKKARRGKGWR